MVPPQALRASKAANAVDLDAERGSVLGVAHPFLGVDAQARTEQGLPSLAKGALSHCR
jgi:hypothetical protein